MITVLILAIFGLFGLAVKYMVRINYLIILLRKQQDVTQQPNELEKRYQFIKGLY